MKLLFLGSGNTVPSCRFRVMQFVPHLRAAGHQCVVANSFPQKYDYIRWLGFRPSQTLKRLNRYLDLIRAWYGDFDAIIIERELFHDPSLDLERRFRRLAGILVLDIDDALFLNFREKSEELAEMADLVFAGNRHLAEWAKEFNANVAIMPTCISTQRYAAARRTNHVDQPLVVGWMGTSSNLGNLKIVAEALRETARVNPFEFRIVSDHRGLLDEIDFHGLSVRYVAWSPTFEVDQLAGFDIGIMPLLDDEWCRYKCAGKLLQYMAMSIPAIASPVGVNADIIEQDVNGCLASTTEEWKAALIRLLGDRELRLSLGRQAALTVEQNYSFEANSSRWIAAVEATLDRVYES